MLCLKNNLIGAQVFGKAKNYKPTWTQNHPLAEGQRMVLCPALEKIDKKGSEGAKNIEIKR